MLLWALRVDIHAIIQSRSDSLEGYEHSQIGFSVRPGDLIPSSQFFSNHFTKGCLKHAGLLRHVIPEHFIN